MKQSRIVPLLSLMIIAVWICIIVIPSDLPTESLEKISKIDVQTEKPKTPPETKTENQKPPELVEIFDMLTAEERRIARSIEVGMTLEEVERKLSSVGKLKKVIYLGGTGAQNRIYKLSRRELTYGFQGVQPQILASDYNGYGNMKFPNTAPKR